MWIIAELPSTQCLIRNQIELYVIWCHNQKFWKLAQSYCDNQPARIPTSQTAVALQFFLHHIFLTIYSINHAWLCLCHNLVYRPESNIWHKLGTANTIPVNFLMFQDRLAPWSRVTKQPKWLHLYSFSFYYHSPWKQLLENSYKSLQALSCLFEMPRLKRKKNQKKNKEKLQPFGFF